MATPPKNPFEDISGIYVLVLALIAGITGLLSLVMRIDTEFRNKKKIPRLGIFVVSHMLGAFVASILAFAITQMNANGVWMQIIIIIAASFTGSRFIEKVTDLYIGKEIKKDEE